MSFRGNLGRVIGCGGIRTGDHKTKRGKQVLRDGMKATTGVQTPSVVPEGLIRTDVATLKYAPVQSLESIAQEVGLCVEDLIKMDANENAYGTPEEVKSAIADAFGKLHIYPGAPSLLTPSFRVRFRFSCCTKKEVRDRERDAACTLADPDQALLKQELVKTLHPNFQTLQIVCGAGATRRSRAMAMLALRFFCAVT